MITDTIFWSGCFIVSEIVQYVIGKQYLKTWLIRFYILYLFMLLICTSIAVYIMYFINPIGLVFLLLDLYIGFKFSDKFKNV